eukprot:TRINITY_DN11294_c1_g1_i1.p1 TRINITY_DN11294_c1_g1~~TRINITY_DN11294_c1_g1_i1.p1  ORF type:complete len:997 (+),score=102.06 TRINITY_DN11294_c1_g1_i1:66-3056(+)
MSKAIEMVPHDEAKKKYSKLPMEIDKVSVVRYLKKDVSKTQLYRSLPMYLLILVIWSVNISLRRSDDPTGYWVNSKVKEALVGDVLPNHQKEEFFEVNSKETFWAWFEKQILMDTGKTQGGYVSLTGFTLLRQFRGKSYNCNNTAEQSLFPGYRTQFIPTICFDPYQDSSCSTARYGPENIEGKPMFFSNREYNFTSVQSPPLQGSVEKYGNWRNAFPILIPNGVDSEAPLIKLLLAKINAVSVENYAEADVLTQKIDHINGGGTTGCHGIVKEDQCNITPGCNWGTNSAGCVPMSATCKKITNITQCTSPCLWSDQSGCFNDCPAIDNETACDFSGCSYNSTSSTCSDPRPLNIAIIEGLISLGWVDELTRVLTVDQLLYNANSKHFIYITYFIEILPVGMWIPQVKSLSFHVLALWSTLNKVLFSLDVIITVYITWSFISVCLMFRHNLEVGKVGAEQDEEIAGEEVTSSVSNVKKKDSKKNKKKTWLEKIVSAIDFAIIFELVFTVIFAVSFGWKWAMWQRGINMSKWTPADNEDVPVWNSIVEYLNIANTEKVLTATAVILAWLRLFEYVQYNERLNSLTETIKIATGSLISLGMIFLVIFIGFIYAGNLAFGIELSEFNTLLRTSGYMLRLLFSAEIDDYSKFRSVEPNWSVFYFGLFFALAWLVLLNMVLAIITSSFNVVKENSKDENGEDTSPSWEVGSVMTDIKKFFKKITTREQPFAFSAHSVNRTHLPRDDEEVKSGSGALDVVKGNYIVDRVRAIQMLDLNKDDHYFTQRELGDALYHLHPKDVKRIFAKSCCETSFGSRTSRQTDRQATMVVARVTDIEKTVQQLVTQVSDQEGLLKTSHNHLLSVQDELGAGLVKDINETAHNIDSNVYKLPPHIADLLRTILTEKLMKLQRNVGVPIDGLLGDMDELINILNSPKAKAVSNGGDKAHADGTLSSPLPPVNPLDSAFPTSPRPKTLIREGSPKTPGVQIAASRVTLVEGVVSV